MTGPLARDELRLTMSVMRRTRSSVPAARGGAGQRLMSVAVRPLVSKGNVSAMRHIPRHILRPPYAATGQPAGNMEAPEVHGGAARDAMRRAGAAAAEMLTYAGTLVRVGVTTEELDAA